MLKRTSLALVLAVVLMLSLFTTGVFAEEPDESATDTAAATVDTSAAEADDTTADTTADTAEADDKTDAPTEPDSEAGTTTDDGHDHDHEEEEAKGFGLADIISLAVLGIIIILVVVYCLTHKEKVGKFCRGLMSEFKKIVWSPWSQVRKNTVVVLVVVIATAAVIAGVDLLFSKAIIALGNLI